MKRTRLTVLLALALFAAALPYSVSALTSPYFHIQINGGIKSVDYAINPEDPEDFSQYSNSDKWVYIDSEMLGRDLKKGDRIYLRLNLEEGYTMDKTIYSYTFSGSTVVSYNAKLLPPESSYVLPEGLAIRDSQGSDIPSAEGKNWELKEDAENCVLHIYCDDAVLSGHCGHHISLHGNRITYRNLTQGPYDDTIIEYDPAVSGDSFRLTVLGQNSFYSVYSFRPELTIAGSGTLKLKALETNSYYIPSGAADLIIDGTDDLLIDIDYKSPSVRVEGRLTMGRGCLSYRSTRNIESTEILDGIANAEDMLIPVKAEGDRLWSRGELHRDDRDYLCLTIPKNDSYEYVSEFILRSGFTDKDLAYLNKDKLGIRQAQLNETPVKLRYKLSSVSGSGKAKLKVSWNKIPGANCYYINGKRVSGTSASFKVARGSTCCYSVYAAFKSGDKLIRGPASDITVEPAPKKTSIYYCKSSATGALKIKWRKAAGADCYQVSISTSRTEYERIECVLNSRSLSRSDLTRGQRYYIKVRAIGENGKPGPWSGLKTVKIR